jgi:hypothetical protein
MHFLIELEPVELGRRCERFLDQGNPFELGAELLAVSLEVGLPGLWTLSEDWVPLCNCAAR